MSRLPTRKQPLVGCNLLPPPTRSAAVMVCKWKQAIWAAIERKLLVGRWPDTVNWRYLRSSSEASGPGTELQVPPPTLENPSLSSGGFRRSGVVCKWICKCPDCECLFAPTCVRICLQSVAANRHRRRMAVPRSRVLARRSSCRWAHDRVRPQRQRKVHAFGAPSANC